MNDPLLNHFANQWQLLRRLTRDLLMFMSEDELKLSPGAGLGPWWKQFRHVARVQENYLDALTSGTVIFGCEKSRYAGGSSKLGLLTYLEQTDRRLNTLLKEGLPRQTVNWFGEHKPVVQHFLCLSDHELLHHGQWIIYRRLLGGAFPQSWRIWDL